MDIVGGTDTGVADEANEAPFSIAEIPGGWFVLFFNDFDFVCEDTLKSLSARGTVVACQVSEGMMASTAYGYERGEPKWSLMHNSGNGITDLDVTGSPPPEFAAIRDRLSKEQEENGDEDADIDCFIDIPLETAGSRCPYRHDRATFDWGAPAFTVVEVR